MKNILLKISFIIIGLLFGLLLTEGILDCFEDLHLIHIDPKMTFAKDPFVYSPTLKYTIKPYLTRNCTVPGNPTAICYANYLGFRDTNHTFQKPPGVYRIVLIGDSLTYNPGVNYNGTYPSIFEQIVEKNNISNKKIEIINLGMIFYGPQQYYYIYKQYGEKYHPDLVIMSYHLLTDPFDAYEYNENRRFYFFKSLPDLLPYSISQPLKEHSYLFRLLLSAYYHWANNQLVVSEGKYKNAYQVDTQLTVTSPDMKEGWSQTNEYVGALVNAVKANGTKIAIIIFPNRAQVDPSELTYMKNHGEITDKRLYTDSATRKEMILLCNKNKWPCLDLQNPLRTSNNPALLFLNNDIHLTKAGNTIAANSLYKFLIKNKLIY